MLTQTPSSPLKGRSLATGADVISPSPRLLVPLGPSTGGNRFGVDWRAREVESCTGGRFDRRAKKMEQRRQTLLRKGVDVEGEGV